MALRGAKFFTLQLTLTFLFFFFFFSVSKLAVVRAQPVPPARQDGFLYTNHAVDSETILIEAYLDPVCPDSRDSWPPLKQVVDHYGSRVWVVVHLVPLPYHDNAFAASRALHIANSLNSSTTFTLLEAFFQHQERFYNDMTENMSKAAVVSDIIKFTRQQVGNKYYKAMAGGFSDRTTDLQTRISFKYSSSKGVYATPFFYLNGFALPGAGSPIDYKGWTNSIDPLIVATNHHKY